MSLEWYEPFQNTSTTAGIFNGDCWLSKLQSGCKGFVVSLESLLVPVISEQTVSQPHLTESNVFSFLSVWPKPRALGINPLNYTHLGSVSIVAFQEKQKPKSKINPKPWQPRCNVSSRPAGGLHDQGEACVPDGQWTHQHVRPDHQEHRLRCPVHPRCRHHCPVECAACPPTSCPPLTLVYLRKWCKRPLFGPELWLVKLQCFAAELVGKQTCNVVIFFFNFLFFWGGHLNAHSFHQKAPPPPTHPAPFQEQHLMVFVCSWISHRGSHFVWFLTFFVVPQ